MARLLKVVSCGLAIMALGIFIASCGSSNAQYRIVNAIAAPSGPQYAVDIYVNNTPTSSTTPTPTFPDVGFESTVPNSGYQRVASGGETLLVFQTTQTANPWVNTPLNLASDTDYTVVLGGNTNASGATYPYEAHIVTDTNPTPNTGQLMFRILDASLSTGSVDVYISPTEDGFQTGGKVASGLSYPTTTNSGSFSSNYTNVGISTSGNLTAYVTVSGTTTVIGISPTYAVSAGQLHTIVLVDQPGGTQPPGFLLLTP